MGCSNSKDVEVTPSVSKQDSSKTEEQKQNNKEYDIFKDKTNSSPNKLKEQYNNPKVIE